ncbi:MAG: AAA family ATPase, partial [Clostridia bacterium]|nr:AAA family ATPase [Clostridia bacterium]
MRALKLAVQSFRNLKPQEINLDHDITLIVGDNGQGKSSI